MAGKVFAKEEMDHLRSSSYVLDASPNIVHFFAEFKAKLWDSVQEGKTPSETVAEMGIDADMLGKNRIIGSPAFTFCGAAASLRANASLTEFCTMKRFEAQHICPAFHALPMPNFLHQRSVRRAIPAPDP